MTPPCIPIVNAQVETIESFDNKNISVLNDSLQNVDRKIRSLEGSGLSRFQSATEDGIPVGNGSSFITKTLPACATTDSVALQYNATSNSFFCTTISSGGQLYTADDTFVAPTGVTKVFITMCGGGGGGGGGDGGAGGGGGGGSGAECIIKYPYTVVAGNSYDVDVGAKGTGGADLSAGTDGADSIFNSDLTVDGGNKGSAASGAGGAAVAANTINASGSTGGFFGSFGGGSGDNGTATPGGDGGGGGASQFGSGGAGGTTGNGSNGSGFGSGGGGANDDGAGGDGASGFILIEY